MQLFYFCIVFVNARVGKKAVKLTKDLIEAGSELELSDIVDIYGHIVDLTDSITETFSQGMEYIFYII